MAATHQLGVSLTLDDLGWHFGNWHHDGYTRETLRGLKELGAEREAALFEAAYSVAQRYWRELGGEGFIDWYHGSLLEKELEPLNDEIRALCNGYGPNGLLSLWVDYGRRHPTLLCE